MQRMLSRRGFVGMSAAALAARALAPTQLAAQVGMESAQISIMMWTLKKFGTFEQNLDKVAFAGYHHIELTGEYKTWSDDDYKRILGRMDTLRITVDAISGVSAGFADPAGKDAFPCRPEWAYSGSPAPAVQADHPALGETCGWSGCGRAACRGD